MLADQSKDYDSDSGTIQDHIITVPAKEALCANSFYSQSDVKATLVRYRPIQALGLCKIVAMSSTICYRKNAN